jgi:HK97 family phage portal protein
MGLRAAWKALWEGGVPSETKLSPTVAPIVVQERHGQAAPMRRSFAGFADEGYQKNIMAFRSIREIAVAVGSVPWLVNGEDNHPLVQLLNRPNPMMARAEFFQNVIGFYLISGNSFIERIAPETGARRGEPSQLWPLRPDRMAVLQGRLGIPAGYTYSASGEKVRWEVDQFDGQSDVLHMRTFNPLDDWYGMSPMEAAARSIDQHNLAGDWNRNLLNRGGHPLGAFVYEPRDKDAPNTLTEPQFQRVKEQIDKTYAGAQNAGRPLILDGGMTWQGIGFSPLDMDFLNSKNTSARDIAQAFGVPPLLLGLPGDNTFKNFAEARLALWEDTVIPLLRDVRDELNAWLGPLFGGAELENDLDEIPALILRRESLFKMVENADFMTINEKREQVGLEPIEGANVILVPATMLPLEQALEPPDDGDEGEVEDDETDDEVIDDDDKAAPVVTYISPKTLAAPPDGSAKTRRVTGRSSG